MMADTSDTDKNTSSWSELAKYEIQILHNIDMQVVPLRYFKFIKNNYKRYTQITSSLFTLDILQPPQFLH